MRKTITVILVLMVCFAVFAANGQKIYSVTDTVWRDIEKLYIMQGLSIPSSSGPWSEQELLSMLSKIDVASLKNGGKELYQKVSDTLNADPKIQFDDNLGMEFGVDFSLEGYYHTNTTDFTAEEDWLHGFKSRKALMNFSFEAWATDNMYGYFEIEAGTHFADYIYAAGLTLNTEFLYSTSGHGIFEGFDWTMPYRAFASVGGEHWNVMAGRDKLSWGAGETGNLMLSDEYLTHTMVKFSTFFKSFKYSLVGTMSPIYKGGLTGYVPGDGQYISQYSTIDGYKSFIAHRLEFRTLKDRLTFTLNEACLYYAVDNSHFNMGMINPFGFMHDEYFADNGNSLLVGELDFALAKGLNIYAQAALDDFVGPGESPEADSPRNPTSYAFLGGIKYVTDVADGVLKATAEGAYVSPFCYLRGVYWPDTIVHPDDDWKMRIAGFHNVFKGVCGNYGKDMFLTYSEGTDCIVGDFRTEFSKGSVTVGADLKYKTTGVIRIDSLWGMYCVGVYGGPSTFDENTAPSTPATSNPFDSSETGVAEKALAASLTATWKTPSAGLSINGSFDFVSVKNKGNVEGNDASDIQISLGVSYSI